MSPPIEIDAAALASLPLPMPDDDAAKHERGQVLVVGGGEETPGAVLLAGLAALRAGAGKLQIATAGSAASAVAVAVPEARVVGLPASGAGGLKADGAARVAELAGRADAVLFGPGILDDEGTEELLAAIVAAGPGSLVVDAGAMGAAGRAGSLGQRAVLVPNAGEVALLGDDQPLTVAARLGAVVACRAADTLIASPDGRSWLDRTGVVGLATSGSGDVAAGIVAGLAARGASPEAAAVWGVHLHGRAGERCANRVGPLGFLARELLGEIPRLLSDLAP